VFDKLSTVSTRPFTIKLLSLESASQGNCTECGLFLLKHFEDIVGALSRMRQGLTPFEYAKQRRSVSRSDVEVQRLPTVNDSEEIDRAREIRTNLYETLLGTMSFLSF
jgi:hypothetical protein